jgi:hypothetical protein
MDLSRFRAASSSHLCRLNLEGQGAFPAQSRYVFNIIDNSVKRPAIPIFEQAGYGALSPFVI